MTDSELISRYVDHDAHDAFEELVHRHVNWINSMAARLTHDRALADDVTQAVFLLLARKAGTLRRQTVVSTWLFTVTRYCAANALRREIRRKEHERRAATMAGMQADQSLETSNWNELSPMLDELVAGLRTGDRQIVLMRFYEQKSFPEIGEALRISEEAARKRVSRSIEKLRELFARRGVTIGAAALATALSASLSKPASAAVIASSAAQAGAAATLTPIAKGASVSLFLTSLKPIAAVVGSILVAGAAFTAALQLRSTPPTAAAPTTAPTEVAAGRPRSYGRVIGPDSAPLAGARIDLINSTGLNPRIIATVSSHPPQGSFVLPLLPDSTAIIVQAPGLGLTSFDLVPNAGPESGIEIKMRKVSQILAHFIDPDNKPAVGVRVSISQISDSRQRWQVPIPAEMQEKLAQTTDAQGNATFDGMPENSVVQLDVLNPRFVKLQVPAAPSRAGANDPNVWVGPSGVSRSDDLRLELAGTISGAVTYADTGKPAAGVALLFQWQPAQGALVGGPPRVGRAGGYAMMSAITDANGIYRRPQLYAGDYVVMLEGGGEIGARYNAPAMSPVTVAAGKETTSQDIKLTTGGIVRGKVVSNDKGVSGVRLMISGPAAPMNIESMRVGRFGQPVLTGTDGTYEFHAPPGEQTVSLGFPLPDGFSPITEVNPSVTVESGKTAEVGDFELVANAQSIATGRVIDAGGKPVAGARVSVQGNAPLASGARGVNSARAGTARRSAAVFSGADGSFSFGNIGPRTQLRAQKGDLVSPSIAVPEDNSPMTFRLDDPSLSSIIVQVRDSAGDPVHDARVALSITSGRGTTPQGQQFMAVTRTNEGMVTGANGNCIFNGMDSDVRYMLEVSARGFGSKSIASVDLKPGQRTEVPVVLPRMDSYVSGIVLDKNLNPAAGIEVYIGSGVGSNMESNQKVRSDANGRFRVEGFVEGSTTTATIRQADGYFERRQIVRSGVEDNIVIDRPTATIARGAQLLPMNIPASAALFMPEERDAANALIALGATVSEEFAGRGSPVTTVNITRAGATDEQIKPLAQLKSVETLVLANSNITDKSMPIIGGLHELTQLSLHNAKITSAGAKQLKQLKFLKTLTLSSTEITDEVLPDIAQLPLLNSLTLSNTKVTDAGLKHLVQMKHLATLNLASTTITDQGLKELKAIPSLRALSLRLTGVTDAGVKELQDALPQVRITR